MVAFDLTLHLPECILVDDGLMRSFHPKPNIAVTPDIGQMAFLISTNRYTIRNETSKQQLFADCIILKAQAEKQPAIEASQVCLFSKMGLSFVTRMAINAVLKR